MLTDELARRKIEAHGLRDEADLLAFEAVGDILHRQWLYESVAPGYGDRRMAVRYLGDVIRRERAQLARAEKVIEAARKYIDNEKHYDEFVSAVIEYDRPSVPLDAQEGGNG